MSCQVHCIISEVCSWHWTWCGRYNIRTYCIYSTPVSSQVLLHSNTHQSKSCTTIHCKKVHVYALTATDWPCCSTSTLYPLPLPRSCSTVSKPHWTRTDTASDPRRARYTDTVTFLTASVGAVRIETYHTGKQCHQLFLASLPVTTNPSSNGTWIS